MYIDTHCHLDDEKFIDNSLTVARFKAAGVGIALNMGCDYASSLSGRELSEKYAEVYFAAGFHPEYAGAFIGDAEKDIIKLAAHRKCVAIGEIGLDYHYEGYDAALQKDVFARQLALSNVAGLPVSIHSRDAHADTLDVIRGVRPINGGVMHCFSGSVEIAKLYLDLGFYIAFGGTLTFKNSKTAVKVAEYVPIDRILSETDSPYLAPEPKRGTVNEPSNIPFIVKKIAEIKGLDEKAVENAILDNSKRLFKKLK